MMGITGTGRGHVRFSGFSDATPGTSSREVMDVQGKLLQLGYMVDVTGSYDAVTSSAILSYRDKMGLPPVDMIDAALITSLEMQGRPGYEAGITDPNAGGGSDIGGLVVGGLILGAAYLIFKD